MDHATRQAEDTKRALWTQEKGLRVRDEWDAQVKLGHAIGLALHARRTEVGLTREELAGAVDSTPGIIAGVEEGRIEPSTSLLRRLAFAMDSELTVSFTPKSTNEVAVRG